MDAAKPATAFAFSKNPRCSNGGCSVFGAYVAFVFAIAARAHCPIAADFIRVNSFTPKLRRTQSSLFA
jgi:hypothetical protein